MRINLRTKGGRNARREEEGEGGRDEDGVEMLFRASSLSEVRPLLSFLDRSLGRGAVYCAVGSNKVLRYHSVSLLDSSCFFILRSLSFPAA